MVAVVYDGKALVSKLSRRIKREAERFRAQHHIEVCLGILLVTGDQVSMADAGKVTTLAEQLGIKVETERVAQRNVGRRFFPTLEEYAASPFIQGIYIQLPLPTHIIPLAEVMRRLPPEKDVGGLHFVNRGIATYAPHEVAQRVHPPEIVAVVETLRESGFVMRGGDVVIVSSEAAAGQTKILAGHLYDKGCNVRMLRYSNIAGTPESDSTRKLKPVNEGKREQETIINPNGDAVISWTNHPGWLSRSRLHPDSIVIDMGYKFTRGKMSGDCDFLSVNQSARFITPVPGGVRNVTHVMILKNLIDLIEAQMAERQEAKLGDLKRRFGGRESGKRTPPAGLP